jgi:glycerol-3-phosphate dehydrogenase
VQRTGRRKRLRPILKPYHRRMDDRHVAVVGGGINGVMSAWALLDRGYRVSLFEAGQLIGATSRASSKMLHGGLRYLEQGRVGMVREALLERRWWLERGTGFAAPFRMHIPLYRGKGRPGWMIRAGTLLYDLLALGSRLPRSARHSRDATLAAIPGLQERGLLGSVSYWDVRMDDEALGRWAAEQLIRRGLLCHIGQPILRLSADGELESAGESHNFDAVVNATGPWATLLLEQSGIACPWKLMAVRGSHLVVARPLSEGCLFQQDDGRVVFYLPFRNQAILGTTEARADPRDPVRASETEVEELLTIHARHVKPALRRDEIVEVMAGLRPIVVSRGKEGADTRTASRESLTVRTGKVVTLLGGKWTTARQQGLSVADEIDRICRRS